MARYWIVVGGPEIYATTRDLGFTKHGFKSTRRVMAGKIEPGDMIAFYITGKKQFAGTVKVTGKMAEDRTRVWTSSKKPDELYPYRVDIAPDVVLDEADWIDAEPYHDRFTWTQKWPRANWTLAYQGNLHEVPESDFEMLRADLAKQTKAAAKG
ncbi:MAG: EVE domain-containing protein [Tepidiformaceae bacterium]